MRAVVGSALANPGTTGTKVVVIGFSLGGGEALVRAATLAESVAGVIAYYPTLTFIGNTRDTAVRITVPTLVLAGEQDMYRACCLVETARAFETAAREAHSPVILLTYAGAGHGFNLGPPTFEYDAAATAAAWEQTRAFLAKHLPLN
jgi:carboxymethylenebutenolidase